MNKIPVFVFKTNPGQVGNGIYSMIACFTNLGVHVPFTFEAHSENEYMKHVGIPFQCNGYCEGRNGHMEDFAKPRHDSTYEVKEIVDKALVFGQTLKTNNI